MSYWNIAVYQPNRHVVEYIRTFFYTDGHIINQFFNILLEKESEWTIF